jgi:shikimate kinase
MSAIFLLGFMGCGKSAVARHLARDLRLPLIDLDAHIETHLGSSIAAFFASHGEMAFREVETEILRLVSAQNAVISLGGGVPTQEINRDILTQAAREGALVVYLQASASTLAARIRRAPGKRPLIDGEGKLDFDATLARVEELMAQREGFYLQCANFSVYTDQLSIFEVAQKIETVWRGQPDSR